MACSATESIGMGFLEHSSQHFSQTWLLKKKKVEIKNFHGEGTVQPGWLIPF